MRCPSIPVVALIHVRLSSIIYQNLAICFLSLLSCFNPLISILFAYPVATAYPVPVPVPRPTGEPLLAGIGKGTEAEAVGAAALEGVTVTVTVNCVVEVTVVGTGQPAPDPIGLPGRLEGRTEEEPEPVGGDTPVPVPVGPKGRVPLDNGYGAPMVAGAIGRPLPVPLCAVTEAERARMLASVVKIVNGAIAMCIDSIKEALWTGRSSKELS